MPASAEFAALCQAQIAMMAAVVGADSSAVYLAESWSEQAVPNLIPVAIYPPAAASTVDSSPGDRLLPGATAPSAHTATSRYGKNAAVDAPSTPEALAEAEPSLSAQQAPTTEPTTNAERLAIPLIHEGGVFGILVSWRADRPWQPHDRDQLEKCARSITLACVLDQRGQWLNNQLNSLDRVQNQQSDRFHELLHQLRSPLTALKTFGKLLAKRLPQEDQNQTLVVNMLRESDRMQELLGYFDDTLQAADETREETSTTVPLLAPAKDDTDILEAAALPAKPDSLAHFGGVLQIQPWAIAPLIAPLVELTKSLAEVADMTLHVCPPEDTVWVRTDSKALLEILNNFIDNSLKYSPPGTHLWLQWGIASAAQPELTGIVVGDTGPGIPEADQNRIFERHYRGVQAEGDLDGSGLGLAIAHDLVHEMQGYIDLYSPLAKLPWALPDKMVGHEGAIGTAFVIWLPKVEGTATDSD